MNSDAGRAWAEFFLHERRVLTVYALALTGHPADAQDLIQDVLVRMVAEDRPVQNAKAYALRCLRNLAIDRQRAAAARAGPVPLPVNEVVFLDPDPADLERRETVDRLRTALRRLTPGPREIIVLRVYGELTFREIAEILVQPLGTVTSIYRRGLETLRAIYTEGEARVS